MADLKEKTYVEDVDRSVYDIRDAENDAYRMESGLTPEIVEKLSRNVDRVIAEEVADKLCELGLIDDGTYAKKLARHFLLTKKYGARRAEFEMRRKGIDGRLAAEAVAEVEPDEDLLEELALKKYGRYLEDDPDGKGRDKAIRGLMRLGHGYYEAEAAVDAAAARLEADTDEPEDL